MRSARTPAQGFSLVELSVVFTVVAILLASAMYTLSAQVETRNFEDTRRRLEQARELLLAFAITNGRLPCPARSAPTAAPVTVAGEEVRTVGADPECFADAAQDNYGGTSGAVTLGLLPARTIGFQQTDAAGFAVDVWGNRIRYAVARLTTPAPPVCPRPHFTNATNLKTNGIGCQPNDLLICASATGITATTCGGAANQIMTTSLVVAIIYSTGKNGAGAAGGIDEAANRDGDRMFVYHAPTPSSFANGEFDDQFTWITHGELYGRMIAAGVLP